MNDEQMKQYHEAYRKKKHEQFHDYGHESLSDWRTKPDVTLLAEEVSDLYWKKLASIGWRVNSQELFKDELLGTVVKTTQFIFTCPDCGKALKSQQSHTITTSKAKEMTEIAKLSHLVKKHKEETIKGCIPIEYDENGEVISEAVAEATPKKAPIFERPSTGTLRIDTIDGETKAFNGERWVSIS